MDYCEGGSLVDLINKRRKLREPFEEDEILNIIDQILLGLKYLHGRGVVHRDIKIVSQPTPPESLFCGYRDRHSSSKH